MAGRKPIDIDIPEVERLAGCGLTEEEICLSLGISTDTIGRRKKSSADFAEALKRGKAKAATEVANALMTLVREGNLGAIVWYEKTRRGLTDKTDINVKAVETELRATLDRLRTNLDPETYARVHALIAGETP